MVKERIPDMDYHSIFVNDKDIKDLHPNDHIGVPHCANIYWCGWKIFQDKGCFWCGYCRFKRPDAPKPNI